MNQSPPSTPKWIGRRALLAVPVVAGVTALTFVLIHLAPGDPIYALAGDGGSPAYLRGHARPLRPGPTAAVAIPDLHAPRLQRRSRLLLHVSGAGRAGLLDHLPSSLLLGGAALAFAVVCGVTLGMLASIAPDTWLDRAIRVVMSVIYAAPVFWTGQVLMLLFALKLGLFPVAGMASVRESLAGVSYAADVTRHLILPAVVLALPFIAVVTSVLEPASPAGEPFIRAAAAASLDGDSSCIMRPPTRRCRSRP